MQDQVDASTGEVYEPLAARGDILPAGLVHYYADFEKVIDDLPIAVENDAKGNRSKYASYEKIMSIVRPILRKHGFVIIHGQTRSWSSEDKTRLYVIYTDIIHTRSGQFRRTQIEMPVPKLDPQAVGSAMTYGKRYTLLAALGLASSDDPTDDDGASAKANDLAQGHESSVIYDELLQGLNGAKDIHEWRKNRDVDKKIKRLNETEFGMLRARFEERMRGDEPS